MGMTILSVAYPFARVAPDTPGGAEQILLLLDRKLARDGHRSLVAARQDSQVTGTLIPMPSDDGPIDASCQTRVRAGCALALRELVARERIDVIHMHGIDFHSYLPPEGPPVLVTLHLPLAWYDWQALRPSRTNTHFVCVSESQHKDAAGLPNLHSPIENGIDVEAYSVDRAKGRFALMLSRICPEKGIHLALSAAKQAGIPLVLAGCAFAYEEHRRYFDLEIRPHLGRWLRCIGPVGPARKRALLACARCVLIASTVPETSSLAAREAMAAGTPVIAFSRGALPGIIENGRTGFLVSTVEEMADAIGRAEEIDPECCRAWARRCFSGEQMFGAYLKVYAALAKLGGGRIAFAA
jgi:glycosyltransferase involved in cell wall biosynthesis